MKNRIIIIISVLLLTLSIFTACNSNEKNSLYADNLNSGTYNIEVDSSSSMFKIIDCQLTVEDNGMSAVLTLSGTGYEKLFIGTSEQALSADDAEYIYFKENSDGKYSYEIPVEELNTEIDCAAWSIRKQKWYDRTILFNAETLPDNAIIKDSGMSLTTVIIAVIIIVAVIAVIIFKRKHRRK